MVWRQDSYWRVPRFAADQPNLEDFASTLDLAIPK